MVVLETGLFLFIAVLAFLFTLFAFRALGNAKGFFHITAIALFSILAIFIGSGYEVAQTYAKNTTDGTTLWQENGKDTFLPGGEQSSWFAWLFSGFAMTNLFLLLKDINKGE